MKKILVIDNYDSFTYNLVHLLKSVSSSETTIVRNDRLELNDVNAFDKILVSPGPGIPLEAGKSMEIINVFAPTKSILGICLGHQAIVEVFGGRLVNTTKVFHGVATPVNIVHDDEKLFASLPRTFEAGRYHSWQADRNYFPSALVITAEDKEGNIMALSHRKYDVKGLQFHPESILTQYGKEMISNWINN